MIYQESSTTKQAIYKDTFYNERKTTLQEHIAEAITTKSEEFSTLYHFYLFFLKFMTFMSSYNI